jgi:hypothetical protein
MTTLRVVDAGSLTLIPPGLCVDEDVQAVGLGRRPDGVEIPRVVGLGRCCRQEDGAEAECGGALDLDDRVIDIGERDGSRRRQS